jgi:dTDP-4-amino-4,6-dideoxygalactose transaminase
MSTHVPIIDMRARLDPIRAELGKAFERVLDSGQFILGPEVEALEQAVASLCRAKAAIGVSSGTDAILAVMMALGIGPGDEVVTTPFSFFATVGAIVRLGARPVFADIDPRTFNLSAGLAADRVGPRTKAVEVVHLFGQCAEVAPVAEAASRVGARIVEDAAQAIGAMRDGTPAGALGSAGCFSFFPTKNLGAIGDGGMVVTSDKDLGERVRLIRVHGARPKYHHQILGANMRLDALQAALLRVMLPRLSDWTRGRQVNAARYDTLIREAGLVDREAVVLPYRDPACEHIYHQYVVRARDRDRLRGHLERAGIGSEVYYPLPLHLQPCLAALGHRDGDFPEAERAAREVLALPIYPELGSAQQERVVSAIAGFYAGA